MPINTEHLQVFATSARTFATKNAKHIQIMKNKVIPQVLGMATILFAALVIYLPDFVNASPKSEFVCYQSEKRLDGKVFLC